MATLLANKIAPGLLDRYLARTGFAGQQTDRPRDPDQPVNLWQPADGSDDGNPDARDFGAHGSFDDRSHSTAPEQWFGEHRGLLLGMAATAVAAGAAAAIGRRPGRQS
jgi:hypothetical protein